MSRVGFDLLPSSTRERVLRGRASRRVHGASIAIAAVAAGLFVGARWLDGHSARQLAAARETGAPVVALEEEIRRLDGERRKIAESLDLQRAVGVAIPASALVRGIAGALPKGSMLESIDLEYANVQGAARKTRRAPKDEAAPREVRGEIAGIAPGESDVGALVDALEALAPLSRVSLESSRSREFEGRSVREFRVTFRIDLERRWKLPALATGATGADSRDSSEVLP
jgi:hypothetical protein